MILALFPSEVEERLRARQLRLVAEEFERCRRRHQWGDSFGVWTAFEMARRSGVQAPEWVAKYLDRVAMRLLAISAQAQREMRDGKAPPSGKTLAASVLRALELSRSGPSVFRRRSTAWRDLALADAVMDLVAAGMSVKAATIQVAAAAKPALHWTVVDLAWRRLYARRIGRAREA